MLCSALDGVGVVIAEYIIMSTDITDDCGSFDLENIFGGKMAIIVSRSGLKLAHLRVLVK